MGEGVDRYWEGPEHLWRGPVAQGIETLLDAIQPLRLQRVAQARILGVEPFEFSCGALGTASVLGGQNGRDTRDLPG